MSNKLLHSFFKDSTIYVIPTLVMYGVNFVLLPLYTRVLSPSDYGALDMLRVVESIALLVVAMEVSQGLGRYYMDEKTPFQRIAYASTAFWFTCFCFTILFILCQVLAPYLSKLILGAHGLENVFRLGVAYISVNGVFLLVNMQFRYELRSKEYVVVSLLTFLGTAFFSVFFAYVLHWGLRGMVSAILIGNTIGLMFGLWRMKTSFRFQFELGKLKEMLMFSAPLVPSGISVFVSGYIDRLMINHYLSLKEVGLYGMGFRVAAVVSLLLVGFNRALSPLIITYYREKETPQQIATIFRIFSSISLFFFLGLSLFSPEILRLLTTPAYYDASKVVIFLVPAILLSQMYMFAPGTSIAKKTIYIMWINLGAAILNTFLNWLLIPKLGFQGAAIATLLAHGCVFAVKMAVSQKYYPIPFNWWPVIIASSIVAVLSTAGLFLAFGTFINMLSKAVIIGLLPFIILWTNLITREEVSKGINKARNMLLPIFSKG